MQPSNGIRLLTLSGFLSALLSGTALAQPAEPPAEPSGSATEGEVPRFESRSERERELQFGAHPEEARLLNTLEGELLALYLPPLTSTPKGALLLTYTGEHPSDCPPGWENLRRSLPHYGWATMLVALPTEMPAAAPPRPAPPIETSVEPDQTPADDQTTAPEPDPAEAALPVEPPGTPAIPRAQRIASRLEAAIAQLEQEGQLNLVVMLDNLSIAAAIAHLKPGLQLAEAQATPQQNPGQSPLAGPVRAVILANTHPHSPLSNQELAQSFSMAQLPLLDLFLGPTSAAQSLRHKGQSQRLKMENYQALSLPSPHAPNSNDHQSFWIKRLEGFMTQQAKGREEGFATER